MNLQSEKWVWDYLAETEKPIIMYGTGNGAQKLLEYARQRNVTVADVFAGSDFSRHQSFYGYTVKTLPEIFELYGKKIVVVLGFATCLDGVLEKIKELSGIVGGELYVPEMPVFGDDVFTPEALQKNYRRISALYNSLADDLSKFTLESLINYKISGKPQYLYACEAERAEIYSKLKLSKSEVYVDAGAFNGDTISEFMRVAGGYKHISAIEPAPINFARLSKFVAENNLNNIELLNCAVSNIESHMYLSAKGGRNPYVSDSGKVQVQCNKMDDILSCDPTYIKYDVEGQEIEAILGTSETIKKCLPKLCVSVYHKCMDFIEIPEYVKSIAPQYKLYLRHYKYLPAWETDLYALASD